MNHALLYCQNVLNKRIIVENWINDEVNRHIKLTAIDELLGDSNLVEIVNVGILCIKKAINKKNTLKIENGNHIIECVRTNTKQKYISSQNGN